MCGDTHVAGQVPVLLHPLVLDVHDLPLQSVVLAFLHLKLPPPGVCRAAPAHLLVEALAW